MKLLENIHPSKSSQKAYNGLLGLDYHKEELLNILELLIHPEEVKEWERKYYQSGLKLLDFISTSSPLIILSGEVGCGKTALANSIATPLAAKYKIKGITLETPSNIRGSGLVGEISNRITHAFEGVKSKVKNYDFGILIIDEADDLGASRSQNQAHHEDRAGLNVLIKQIDQLKTAKLPLAVIMITNRIEVLDPALLRRASLVLEFQRPEASDRKELFEEFLVEANFTSDEIKQLVEKTEKTPLYSYSDLINRILKKSVLQAIKKNTKLSFSIIEETIDATKPTPLLQSNKNIINGK